MLGMFTVTTVQVGWLDGAICLAYLVIVFGLALLSARGQQDNEDYFVGGRHMNWWVVGISMFATSFSSVSFLGLPQRGAYQDFSFYLTILFIPLVITPLLCVVFVPVYVRLRVSSGYEYLGRRFGTPVQRIGSLLYGIYAVGWMGTMLHAVALTLQAVLGLDATGYLLVLMGVGLFATIYTVLGGLKAVIWTDVLQAIVLCGAVVAILILAVSRIDGGWPAFWEIASSHQKFQLVHLDYHNLLSSENFTAPDSLFSVAAYGVFMYLPGYAVAQNMIQRYVCAGTLKGGRGVVVLSAAINTVLGLLFLCVGTALFAFYMQQGGTGLPAKGVELVQEDQILPYFAATQLTGVGLVGLILAGLFAAAMSTIDSGINGVSSVIVFDWLGGRQLSLRISRILSGVLGCVVVAAALYVHTRDDNVIEIITGIAGTSLGMLLAVYLLGILSRRANLVGILLGVAAGVVSLMLVNLYTAVPKWWLGAFAMLPTLVVGWFASLCFAPPPASALEGTLWRGREATCDES